MLDIGEVPSNSGDLSCPLNCCRYVRMVEIIPEMHTLGSINPHTLFVDLNRASRSEIVAAQGGAGAPQGWEIYEHEARHWLDLVSTVWGRSYLDLLFRTYDAILTTPKTQMDRTFQSVLELFDRDRSILFPSYYKYVLPEARGLNPDDRWSMAFSTGITVGTDGQLADSRPLIFVRFDAGSTHFARQPVSDGSLLEARALASEIAATTAWLRQRPAGEEIVTWRLREPEQRAAFYDPELTTYSVAAHVVAYATGLNQIRQNLVLSSKLADIVLNLTDGNFSNLRPAASLGNPTHSRLRGFRKSRNRGYAFCCLAFGLRPVAGSGDIGREEIEVAMKAAGLPTLSKVYDDARGAIDRVPSRLAAHPRLADVRGKLIDAGRSLHRQPEFDASVAELCPSGDFPAPLVGDSACEEFSLGTTPLDMAESEFLFDCHERYRAVLRSALRAARGFEFELTDFVY